MKAVSNSFNRLNDTYFKYVLASPERKYLTIEFLNAALSYYCEIRGEASVVISDVIFLDRESVAGNEGEKVPRFDIFVRSSDGRLFHIEVQVLRDEFFLQRGFFYASRDYIFQSGRGLSYKNFEPVIFIGLVNFNLMGEHGVPRDWYTLHRVTNVVNHETVFNNVEFHMIELPVLRLQWRKTKKEPSTKLEKLLFYFGSIGGEEMMQAPAEKDSTIADLIDCEQRFRADKLLMRRYDLDERARLDYLANCDVLINKNLEKGRKEGLEKGRAEAREEVARNLKLRGKDTYEEISLISGLPINVIAEL